jgi:hypothetical protein
MIPRSLSESSLIAPFHEYYHVAGVVCSLSTNSEFILGAARGSFTPMAESPVAADASMPSVCGSECPERPAVALGSLSGPESSGVCGIRCRKHRAG